MISYQQKPVTVLYLGSLTHSSENSFLDKTRPHEDQIEFCNPVKISLLRIPRPGKDIYARQISITQTQAIKNFQVYYRNLQKTAGRFSLLICNNELMVNQNDDILITPRQPIFTDLLLIKGNFTKITLCIYGNVIRQQLFLSRKCPHFRVNAPIQPFSQQLIQIPKDIFRAKRAIVDCIQMELKDQNTIQTWHEVVNDDPANQQQIQNICKLSQKLLVNYNCQNFINQSFVVEFRTGMEEIFANLSKVFKNKHLGLYYPSFEPSTISSDLSLTVTNLALISLGLSLSEQFRGLEILKYTLQLDRHAEFFIENGGIEKLMKIFVDFFKIGAIVLSTYKILCLEVLISVSVWKKAAEKLIEIRKDSLYHDIFDEKLNEGIKASQQRQRSREKKSFKRSRSSSLSDQSSPQNRKKKSHKQKKNNKSKQKKKGKQQKSKDQLLRQSIEENNEKQALTKALSLRQELPNISFYQLLLFMMARMQAAKQLLLVKILLEQILQTLTKNPLASQRVAQSTSLLKDLKYVFNPSGQVLNTKTLKQFASCYQPFLNFAQSQGIDSDIIDEKEKLKNMRKYGIDVKVCKIIHKIVMGIVYDEEEAKQGELIRQSFQPQFIVMMSEIIRSPEKTVHYGLSHLLNSFKQGSSRDIVHLRRVEAAITLIAEYIYKILLQDDGLYTALNIDQVYSALINITNSLSKDPTSFTKELKRKIKQLTNYAMAYDLFTSSEGNFKTISDYFLRLFKFQHYQINKINDYKKKQFEKAIFSSSKNTLIDILSLGSFHQLLPEQPLLEIDVYLKIFTIVLQYNKNVWPLFYENRLVCGFNVLFVKLSQGVTFLLNSSIERQCILLSMKRFNLNLQNYLTVLLRLVKVLVKKQQYESAFNEALEEDHFENVETFEYSVHLYIQLFNAFNQKSSLLSVKCKTTIERITSKLLEIFDKLIQSYELASHSSRQNKVKELWLTIYEKHFIDLKSRAACLSLLAYFTEIVQNTSLKLFINLFYLQESLKIDFSSNLKNKGHIPINDKSIVQNLILSNIYRSDPVLKNNLILFIKNLLDKHSQKINTIDKIANFIQNLFDSLESKIKQKLFQLESKQDLVLLEKISLISQVFRRLDCILTSKLEQKLLKHLKSLDSIKFQAISQEPTFYKSTTYKLSLKIKANLISFLKKSFQQKPQHPQLLNFIAMLSKLLDLSPKLIRTLTENSFQKLSPNSIQIEKENLNLLNTVLDVLCSFSSNPYSQSILLYEVFLQKPYKPIPQISLIGLFNKLISPEVLNFIIYQPNTEMIVQNQTQNSLNKNICDLNIKLRQIATRMTYFLCQLTTIDFKEFYSTESRRNAIICLMTEDRDFPFTKLNLLKSIIPLELIQTLCCYFDYPIVEKPLVVKVEQKKPVIKNKGYMFSKALFSIIMEGQPVTKARHLYVGGPWKGGDLKTNFLYTPTKERNYQKIIQKSIQVPSNLVAANHQLMPKWKVFNEQKATALTIDLILKKKLKHVQKKTSVDTQLRLLNIPLVLENQIKVDLNPLIRKVSPSPSTKSGYGKNTQIYDNRAKISPSPPNNRIPSFGGFCQNASQYNSHLPLNTGLSSSGMGQKPGVMTNVLPQNYVELSTSPSKFPQMGTVSNPKPYDIHRNSNVSEQTPRAYPNPYYSSASSMPPSNIQSSIGLTGPYLQMQRNSSQQANNLFRGNSNSAPRSNISYGNAGYQQQQQQTYPGQNGRGYDNRSHSPYQQNKYGYGNQRLPYQQQQGAGYYSQDRGNNSGYGGNYSQQGLYNSNQRQTSYHSQQMGNRSGYGNNSNSNPYSGYNYQTRQPQQIQEYPSTYQQQKSNPNLQAIEEEKQVNQAILLLTELRGTLPENIKNDKKYRLNTLLKDSIRVQNRVKSYLNQLKK